MLAWNPSRSHSPPWVPRGVVGSGVRRLILIARVDEHQAGAKRAGHRTLTTTAVPQPGQRPHGRQTPTRTTARPPPGTRRHVPRILTTKEGRLRRGTRRHGRPTRTPTAADPQHGAERHPGAVSTGTPRLRHSRPSRQGPHPHPRRSRCKHHSSIRRLLEVRIHKHQASWPAPTEAKNRNTVSPPLPPPPRPRNEPVLMHHLLPCLGTFPRPGTLPPLPSPLHCTEAPSKWLLEPEFSQKRGLVVEVRGTFGGEIGRAHV